MAILIPDCCPSLAAVGENRIFGLLRDTLPDHFTAWYEPIVAGRYPDFTLVSHDFSLLMLEIKGWYAGPIARADDNDDELHRTEAGETRVEIHEHPAFCVLYDFCGRSRGSRWRDVRRSVGVPGSTEPGVFPGLLRIVRFVREGSRPRNPCPALGVVLSQRIAFSLSTSRARHREQTRGVDATCEDDLEPVGRQAATAGPPPQLFEETSRTIRTIRRNRESPHFCVLCDFCGQGRGSWSRSVGVIL